VNPGLQQFFHGNRNQTAFSFMSSGLCTRRDPGPAFGTTNQNRDNGFTAFPIFNFRLPI
jgi:hypothetical protein